MVTLIKKILRIRIPTFSNIETELKQLFIHPEINPEIRGFNDLND